MHSAGGSVIAGGPIHSQTASKARFSLLEMISFGCRLYCLYAKYPRNRGSFDIFQLLFEVIWEESVWKEKQELFGGDE